MSLESRFGPAILLMTGLLAGDAEAQEITAASGAELPASAEFCDVSAERLLKLQHFFKFVGSASTQEEAAMLANPAVQVVQVGESAWNIYEVVTSSVWTGDKDTGLGALQFSDAGDTTLYSTGYSEIVSAGGVQYLVLNEPTTKSKESCVKAPVINVPELPVPVIQQSSQEPTVVVDEDDESPVTHPALISHALPSDLIFSVMANRESAVSEYSLGTVPGGNLRVEWKPVPNSFLPGLKFAVSTGAIFSGDGSGLQSADVDLGYGSGPIDVFVIGGRRFEPRVGDDSIVNNVNEFGVLVSTDAVGLSERFKLTCSVQAVNSSYGAQWPASLDVSAGCGMKYVRPEISERVHQKKFRLNVQEFGSYAGHLGEVSDDAAQDGEAPLVEAEHTRLSEEIARLAKRNAWGGVEKFFVELESLEGRSELTCDEYYNGAMAARGLGDITSVYKRLNLALKSSGQDDHRADVMPWLNELNVNYAYVTIRRNESKAWTNLLMKNLPFAPDKRSAVEAAQVQIRDKSYFEGLLPIGAYDVGFEGQNTRNVDGGLTFVVEAGKSYEIDLQLGE